MKEKNILRFGALLFLILFVGFGCRKKQDTIAIIHVRDITNNVVVNAEVEITAESTIGTQGQVDTSIRRVAYSDNNGDATFNFNDVYQMGQAGVGIFNIKAIKGQQDGIGIIKVEQETTSEETVFVQ